MKSLFTVIATVLLAALGGAAMVLGEADDSPGLQGIGLLIIVGVIVLGIRSVRATGRRE